MSRIARRYRTIRSVSVRTSMPFRASIEQEVWSLWLPPTSTMHRRQAETTGRLLSWQRAGISIPSSRAASMTVVPDGTETSRPSIFRVMFAIGPALSAFHDRAHRADGRAGSAQIGRAHV